MSDQMCMDVDTALAEVPVNVMPLIDDTDFKSIEAALVYNQAGLALIWHFVTTAGAMTETAVTPTTAGDYDWTDQGASGLYAIEIPASGGASINNDTEGFGWFTGVATGVLPWRGPIITFRAAAINNLMIDVPLGLTNLQKQYDTTGLTGDNFPATQSQLDGIANVGSAVHRPASSYTLTTGTQSANTFAETEALDAVRHEHTDAAGVMSLEYHFLIGAGTPSSMKITGYVTGGNDDIDVYGYDWVTAGYKQIGNIDGSSSTSNQVFSFDLFVDMVGSGANAGKVDIKLEKASGLSSATLAIDQIFVAFNQGVEGYENAAIWYDDSAANTNTVPGIDGTAGNPVSTEAAVETLLTSTGYSRVEVAPGSTYSLAATHNNRLVTGHGGILELGGQDVDETHFFEMHVSGAGTAATEMEFHDCDMSTASVQKAIFHGCTFGATLTMTLAGDYHFVNCQSGIAGASAPTFTKTAGQPITAQWRRWSSGITVSGLESGDVLTIGGEMGTITLNGADAAVEIRGTYKALVNNLTGSPTVNIDGAMHSADVADILADTADMQPKLGTPVGLDMSTDIANVQAEADAITVAIAALNDLSAAQVNAEVVDALATDTYAEPGSVPAATASLAAKIGWMQAVLRNKLDQTATTLLVRNDADNGTIGTSTVSDDGTNAIRGEFV